MSNPDCPSRYQGQTCNGPSMAHDQHFNALYHWKAEEADEYVPEPACHRCKFFIGTVMGPDADGHCHRYPPVVLSIIAERIVSFWPTTMRDTFCGEFSFKKPEAKRVDG